MIRLAIAALFAAAAPLAASAAECPQPGLAVGTATVKSAEVSGALAHYPIAVTVVNHGSSEASNAMQFVDIYNESGEKLDAKGVPPLKAGDTYSFTYIATRSSDAGQGTSKLMFRLDESGTSAAGDCSVADYVVRF